MVSVPPRGLSVQLLNLTGGLLVTSAIKPDARVLAVSLAAGVDPTVLHVTVMLTPLIVPVNVMLPLLVTVKVVLGGLRESLGTAKVGPAAKAIMAPAAAMTMAILLAVRNMISPLGA